MGGGGVRRKKIIQYYIEGPLEPCTSHLLVSTSPRVKVAWKAVQNLSEFVLNILGKLCHHHLDGDAEVVTILHGGRGESNEPLNSHDLLNGSSDLITDHKEGTTHSIVPLVITGIDVKLRFESLGGLRGTLVGEALGGSGNQSLHIGRSGRTNSINVTLGFGKEEILREGSKLARH